MDKLVRLKTCETFFRRNKLFKNVTPNGEWVNFSCLLAKHSDEHRFKEDGNPSAGITVGRDGKIYYKCFTCKHQGPFAKTIERLELKSKTLHPALKELVEDEQEFPDFEYLYTHVQNEKIKPEPLPFANIFEDIDDYVIAQKYLLSRNISLTTAKNIGLQYDPDGQRIVFPVRDRQGVTYGYTGRSIDPDAKPKIKDYHFQKSLFILGIELWKSDLPTILVEGLFAYAHLHELAKGKYFPYNIGAIMGSSISQEQADILIGIGQPIYCLLDGDAAGRTGVVGTREDGKLKKPGLIHHTKDNIPTFMLKYPRYTINVMGAPVVIQKSDPDWLTFEEVWSILRSPLMVI